MTEQRVLAPFHGAVVAALGRPMDTAWLAEVLAAPDAALPTPQATDRAVWSPDCDPETGPDDSPLDSRSVRDILARAEADLGEPWPLPLASAAARVHRDGDREQWESVAFARQHRLSRAVVAAAVTLEDRWIDEAADGIQLLCEQSSWCWPAHDDAWTRHRAMLPVVTEPFIDLGAGEVVSQLAWADHTLGDALDRRYPGLRGHIRHEARTRIFEPFTARRDWHWLGADGDVHNWSPWIHGNILVAALRLMDSLDESAGRAEIVALALEGIDRYVTALPLDGAIDEGYGYWWNGACRALEALDVACHATDGALDAAFTVPAITGTVAFPHRMHLSGPWFVNVADAAARDTSAQPWHGLHRAAQRVGDCDAAAFATAHRDDPLTEAAGLGRLLRGLTDRAWQGSGQGASPLPRDTWLPSVHLLVARETSGTATGLTLAAKGGHNGEHHNHNDVGSFIVASDGVPVIVDAGRPTYTAATFGPNRYDIWTMQSSWHTVPEMFGTPQASGSRFRARLLGVSQADAASSLTLDLANAYPLPGLRTLRRHVTLDRLGRRVTISDEWVADDEIPDGETSVRLLIAGQVAAEPGRITITPVDTARSIAIRWPAQFEARVVRRELSDPMLTAVWGAELGRIDILPTGASGLSVTIEQEPLTREGAS